MATPQSRSVGPTVCAVEDRLLTQPWRLLRTRWPWTCLTYLACEVTAGWVTLVLVPTIVLLPGWARAWGATERRLVVLAGQPATPTPARTAASSRGEATYLLVTVLVAFLGTLATSVAVWLLLVTLLAPLWAQVTQVRLGPVVVDSTGEFIAAVVLGMGLLAVLLWVVTATAAALARLSGIVLGPDAAQLQRSVDAMADRARRSEDTLALERRALERRLHDGAQLHLSSAAASLGLLHLDICDLPEAHRQPLLQSLGQVRDQLEAAGDAIRSVAHGLVPTALVDEGLCGAIHALVDDLPLDVQMDCELPRLHASVEAGAYLIVSEAITNVLKHAGARHLTIEAGKDPDEIHIRITDDGQGGADPTGGGIIGMTTRARSLGGELHVTSPVGGSTTVSLVLPGTMVA